LSPPLSHSLPYHLALLSQDGEINKRGDNWDKKGGINIVLYNQSENQKELYAKLRKRYKNEYTILPNYPIVKLINFQTEKLVKTFSKEDSLYLQKAFFSFVIINEEGDVIKIYNIANTHYHTKKEYEHKDNLKKEFCTFFDVFFEEII
jgi:hypothetical protein